MDKFLVLDREGDEIPPVKSIKPSDTFEHLLDTFVKQKVHRLYIVDDEHNLKGVISLGDVLALF